SINAQKDTSGIRYVVNFDGKGIKPLQTDDVFINVRGAVMSTGNQIVDHKERYYAVNLSDASSLLQCFSIILPKVKKGSTTTIYSPSVYAYGSTSSTDGALPANSNIIFNVRLLDEVAQFTTDTTALQNYATSKGLNVTKDPSGLRYVITLLGSGKKPVATSSISFNYTAKFLDTEKIFDQSVAPATTQLNQLIKGFQIGMQQLPAGSKAIFLIPSALAYGPIGDRSYTVPSNSNLIFEVELVTVN
ncbi:MAG: FKBP-type peptidyl-prolyl cis-trans isomerase, partial [Flammeovirgaceae bacterium]